MLTFYLIISYMIVRLTLKKACNPHLDPSIIYCKLNLLHFKNILMQIFKKSSFDIPNL
jgi:hypothetical protein